MNKDNNSKDNHYNAQNSKMDNSKINNFKELWPFFKPYKKDILIAIIALIATAIIILAFGKFAKNIIDYGLAQRNIASLFLYLAIMIISVIILAIAGYYRSLLVNNLSEKAIANLKKAAYDKIINYSGPLNEHQKSGDIISRLTVDGNIIYNVISGNITFLIRNIIIFIGSIIAIFIVSLKLTMIALIFIAMAILPIIYFGKKIKANSNELQQAIGDTTSHLQETIGAINIIQSFLGENKESKKFSDFLDKAMMIANIRNHFRALMVASVIAISFGAVAIIIWYGIVAIIDNNLTSGELISFIFYVITAATSLIALSQISSHLNIASSAITRIIELTKLESKIKNIDYPIKISKNNSPSNLDIDFIDVNFTYEIEGWKLQNFNLKIKQGEKIAIIGKSGSGKSTILQLLQRFIEPQSGRITINNIDISQISLKELRQQFAFVAQESFIFSANIFDNIAYFDSNITRDKIMKVINSNMMFDFIKQMPNGLDSFLGERGVKLSGGEKQRIAIARALAKDSPILLLDEATSALDNYNNQNLLNLINDVAFNKTVIMVTHKLNNIKDWDRIIVINNGEACEDGSHEELMGINGHYAHLANF